MTVDDVEEIKEKIEKAKNISIKAQGAKERIMKQLSDDYGIQSIAQIEIEKEKRKEAIKKDEGRLEKLLAKLESSADWENIG